MTLAEYEACIEACEEAYHECCHQVRDSRRVPRLYRGYRLDEWKAAVGYPGCMNEKIACERGCGPRPEPVAEPVPEPVPETEPGLLDNLLDALESALDALARALEEGARWLADHPEVVVGTIVVIAGIALVVTTGPGGALVLVAA